MNQAAKEALVTSKSDFEKMKAIARTYTTKRECSLVMPELWLRRIFPRVPFLNNNLPEKRYKILKKSYIEEVPVDNTDLFQRNMLDRYLDYPNEIFKNGNYNVINKLCFAEFLSPVLYSGQFWSLYTCVGAEKMSPKNRAVLYPKVSFFTKQLTNTFLLCKIYQSKAGHLRRLSFDHVWFGQQKAGKFHEKTCNSFLNPNAQ